MPKDSRSSSRPLVRLVPPDPSVTHVVHEGERFEVGAEEGGVVRVPESAVDLLLRIGFSRAD